MSVEMVECYSGQTYAERPAALYWEEERLEIIQIQAGWRSPEGRHFRVRVKDERIFELFYDESLDEWQVELC